MQTYPTLILFFCANLLLHAADITSPRAAQVAPNDERIATMGRVALMPGKVQMGFPGTTLRFVYRGPAPLLKLTGETANCYFNLSCNGWEPVVIRLKQGENEIALPTGVAPADGWMIELVRRTESWMGVASFDGLLLPEGCELLPPPAWPTRKLMFIGDSLTCGEYIERFPPEDDATPRSTNAARSYGMLLGKWLGAQVHLIAYGGRGITRDWAGKTDTNTLPVFFPLALPDDPASRWDHAKYSPDVIVINVGTDFDAGPLEETKFTEAYTAFVVQVRAAHPQAFILLSESGFMSEGADGKSRATRDQLLRTMQAVTDQRHRSGDERVRAVRCGFYPGTASDGHLVAFQNEQVALELLGPIKEVTGW